MKKRLLLTAILLGVILSFASRVGLCPDIKDMYKGFTFTKPLGELLTERFRGPSLVRFSFLVIPMNQEEMVSMLFDFLDIYPNAEIPEEFALILPMGANSVTEIIKQRRLYEAAKEKATESESYRRADIPTLLIQLGRVSKDLMSSLLLTMAYQQGYYIEHVTNNYVILRKSVYEEELKE